MLTLVVGFVIGFTLHFGETWSILFNMYLSLAAIVIAATILIAQRRDTDAIQAKLDQIILATDADNKLVGIEGTSIEEIEKIRDQQRRGA